MYWIFLSAGRYRRALGWLAPSLLLASVQAFGAEGLTFNQALQLDLRQSPELRAEAARVEAAQQAEGPADALRDPTLILGLDNVPVDGADRYSLSSDFMTMQRIGVTQRFPNRSKRTARAEGARQQIGLTEATKEATRLAVLRQTAQAWIELHTLDRQLVLLEELIAENRLFDKAVRARLSSGQGKAIDSVAPRQEAVTLLDRRDALLARQRQAKARLIRWLGEAGRQSPAGQAPDFAINAEQLLNSLHKHPELEIASRQASVAQANADEARAAKKPDWALTLAYMNREEFSDMAMLQVNVDLPLFSRSRQGPRIASAEAEWQALESRAEAVRREHEAMLQSDLAEYERQERTLARQREQLVPLAKEKVGLARAAWRGGDGSLADLVRARSEWLDAKLKEIDLSGQYDQQAAALHFTYDHHGMVGEEQDNEH